jgi:putative ABC transport system substrate-binding protein
MMHTYKFGGTRCSFSPQAVIGWYEDVRVKAHRVTHLALVAVGFLCASWVTPLAYGQPATVHRIGILNPQDGPVSMEEGLRKGLSKLGYEEDKNLAIEWRRSATTTEEMRTQARDLADSKVELIVALGTPATRAALETTSKPVVFVVGDPVGSGFAASLARPGGNATGVSVLTTELNKKRLEILRQVAPRAKRMAYLHNASNPLQARNLADMEAAARALGTQLIVVDAEKASDLDEALETVKRSRADAFLVSADLTLLANRAKIANAVREAGIPGMFPLKEYNDAGILMSYGPNMDEAMYRASTYIDRIVRGAAPGLLPVQQISTYELFINLRLAREMRIAVPQELLLRADEVVR